MRYQESQLAGFIGSDQARRTVHIWQAVTAPRAVILALHGGMAHAGDYLTPALYFRDKGFTTLAYDLCGHARNARVDIPGFDVFLNDSALFLDWIRATYPGQPIFVMGHSMGGLIAAHLELGLFAACSDIKGVILSSPYFVNAVKVPKVMVALSSVLARWFPTAKVPLTPLTPFLTHDTAILQRHLADEQDNIRAREVSFRFANALLGAQAALGGDLSAWRHPVFAVLAGEDKLADAKASKAILDTIPKQLLTSYWYDENFHENFNEINREAIFSDLAIWLDKQLSVA